jgi:lipopolysaccharide export system protein LptA
MISKVNIFLILLLLAGGTALGQTRVKLEKADRQIGGRNAAGERFDRFVGNVLFSQNETLIYCDSAVIYRERNLVEAFGKVRILEGDSITITSKRLIYDGNTREAKLRENVVFVKKGQVTLYTDFLDYNRNTQEARYFNGGRLVDDVNVLVSRKGYYLTQRNLASFKTNVVGTTPEYVMKSDTLQYHTVTKTVIFLAPTTLTDKDNNVFNYTEGTYQTGPRVSDLGQGVIESENYTLYGDRLFMDDVRRYYRATKNVKLIAKEDDIIITGDFGEYWKDQGLTKVYGNALMKRLMDNDTLYLKADTLVSIDSEIEANKRLLAYRNVKVFKSDMQGISDSLAYFLADSVLHFYKDPVLWNEGNQMTADSIRMLLVDGGIDRMFLNSNAFVVAKDSLEYYNQIKGRNMTALFKEGAIDKVYVNGNGESLFFAVDENEHYLVGMNRIFCSNMLILFAESTLDNITFYIEPEAEFIPPHELKDSDRQLRNFKWREDEKPDLDTMLNSKAEPTPVGPAVVPPPAPNPRSPKRQGAKN